MAHAFLSYVRENWLIVKKLAEELTAAGVDVWLDKFNIEPGKDWRIAIEDAIKSGNFFIACFSKEYEEKHKNVMNEELNLAIGEICKRPDDAIWFIPLMLNECKISRFRIRDDKYLTDLQYIRLFDDWRNGVERILDVILGIDRQYEGIPAEKRQLIHHLIRALYLKFPDERRHAAEKLGRIDEAARPAVDHLNKILKSDPEASVRRAAAVSLGSHCNIKAIPFLVAALNDNDVGVRRASCRSILELGEGAILAARDPSEIVFYSAVKELVLSMGEKDSVPSSLRNVIKDIPLQDANSIYNQVRKRSDELTAAFGTLAVDDLISEVKNFKADDLFSARNPALVLGLVGKDAKKALPILLELAERKVDDWEGGRGKVGWGLYEDIIFKYFLSITSAIKKIAAELKPDESKIIMEWVPTMSSEEEPGRIPPNTVFLYYISNLHELKKLIKDLDIK